MVSSNMLLGIDRLNLKGFQRILALNISLTKYLFFLLLRAWHAHFNWNSALWL